MEKDENVLAGGRKRRRGISSRIMRKKSQRNRVGGGSGRDEGGRESGKGREGGSVHAPLHSTVRLSVPYVLDGPVGPWDQRDGRIADYVHFRFTRMQRLVFPGAVINYDRNRRIRARIVGHAGRRRRPRLLVSQSLSLVCRWLPTTGDDEGDPPFIPGPAGETLLSASSRINGD